MAKRHKKHKLTVAGAHLGMKHAGGKKHKAKRGRRKRA